MFRKTDNLIISSISLKPILIWGITSLFTIFQLFLEMMSNTMTDSLMNSFKINYAIVGLLSSIFFYSFLSMQFPAGIILDKFNIKWVLTITCAGCGVGCLLFGHSTTLIYACISRLIMGGFAAFGFLGLLKISAMWYPSKMFPFIVGISQFLVMSVTALCEPIIVHFIKYYGWRASLNSAGYIAVIIAILIIFLVEHRKNYQVPSYKTPKINNLFSLFQNKQCILASLYGFGMFSSVATFSALWGLSYLIQIYHLRAQEAAFGISMNFYGIAIGCAFFGFIASCLNNYLVILRFSSLLSLILILILGFSSSLLMFQIYSILFLLGFFCGSFFLSFDVVRKSVEIESEGIASAFCNIFVMSGMILLQPVIGLIIDIVKIKSESITYGYRLSMIILVCTTSISLIVSNFIKIDK